MPKISVVIITYNREKYLKEAIESVLEQSLRDFELIIIDDASTDRTPEIIKDYSSRDPRVKYFRNEKNLGISKSRNIALKMAQGKYVAVLDSDDLWLDFDKLKKQYNFLEGNLSAGFVLAGTGVVVIDESGRELKRYFNPLTDASIRREILLRNPIAHSSAMFLKEAVVNLGGYDETLKIGEDYDLWLRIGKRWKFTNLAGYSIKYRAHVSGAWNASLYNGAKVAFQIMKKYQNDYPNYKKALLKASLRMAVMFLKDLLGKFKF